MPSLDSELKSPIRQQYGVRSKDKAADSMTSSFRIFLILTFIMIGRPQDFWSFLAPFRIALVFTLLTLIATYQIQRPKISHLWRTLPEVKYYTIFYMVMIVTIPFAIYIGNSFNFAIMQYSAEVIYFYLMIVHINCIKKLRKILSTFTWSTLFYATSVLVLGWGMEGRIEYGGVYDPNDLAYYMISLFPIALFFWSQKESITTRIRTLATFLTASFLTLLTGSRGGLVGMATVLSMLLIRRDSGIKRAHKAWILCAMAIIVIFFGYRLNLERMQSIADLSNDYNLTTESGRVAIWKRGMRIVIENPITGVGVNNFPMALGLQREAEGVPARWQAAHNAYLEILSETGIGGLFIYLLLLIKTFKNLGRKSNTKDADTLNRAMRLIQIGFAGNLICAFFLAQGYSLLFPIFFAFSAIKRRIEVDLAQGRLQNPEL